MPRICDIHLPQVFKRPGSSFGPMTTSATTAISNNSELSMPNMKADQTFAAVSWWTVPGADVVACAEIGLAMSPG